MLLVGVPHLRDIFYRMGLSDRDIVALSGGHTLVNRLYQCTLVLLSMVITRHSKFICSGFIREGRIQIDQGLMVLGQRNL